MGELCSPSRCCQHQRPSREVTFPMLVPEPPVERRTSAVVNERGSTWTGPVSVVVIVTRSTSSPESSASAALARGRGTLQCCLLGFGVMADTSAVESAKSQGLGGLFHSCRYV